MMVKQSETIKNDMLAMVTIAPQILNEDEVNELKKLTDELATNFETCASVIYKFGRMGSTSKKFAPTNKINK